ncbi:PspA/IM30 family protein [Frankia sp. AgPm24]|uniref:PspA/IM30 family protein n=1 Tax=Frankia sp. AgPm24 TaxID=631128 RepID=UPI0020100C64|nr:PspA/IM30 family protein [Frankia sp. AgPm24]MCK9920476.1 PspA/IM30 family protein [Frankia sp. AgPm24]
MANVVRRIARYLSASANRKFDERADPRVQIDQAIEDARRQHEALIQQAALVLGNQRQLEMQMARQADEVTNLTESARSALLLADRASAAGDLAGATSYEETAQAFASQLLTAESSLEDLRNLHRQAVASAAQARTAVEDNEVRMRRHLTERSRLLTQIEHAAMQEQMTRAMEGMSTLAPASDTPTLAEIRDKVEHRYAVALGRHELASRGTEARMVEVRRATLDARAQTRLAELRGALTAGAEGESLVPPSLTKGDPTAGEGPAGDGRS